MKGTRPSKKNKLIQRGFTHLGTSIMNSPLQVLLDKIFYAFYRVLTGRKSTSMQLATTLSNFAQLGTTLNKLPLLPETWWKQRQTLSIGTLSVAYSYRELIVVCNPEGLLLVPVSFDFSTDLNSDLVWIIVQSEVDRMLSSTSENKLTLNQV